MPKYVNIKSQYLTIPHNIKSYNIAPGAILETPLYLDNVDGLRRIDDEEYHNPISTRVILTGNGGTVQEFDVNPLETHYIKVISSGKIDLFINSLDNNPAVRINGSYILDLRSYLKITKLIISFIEKSDIIIFTLKKGESNSIFNNFSLTGTNFIPNSVNSQYYFEPLLNVFLSIDIQQYNFFIGSKRIIGSRWLNSFENIPSNITGHVIGGKDMLLDKILYMSGGIIGNTSFNIFDLNNLIYTFTISNQSGEIFPNLILNNLNELKVEINNTPSDMINYPTVYIFLRKVLYTL